MFWSQLLLSAVIASSPHGGCSCDRIGSQLYNQGPADVDLGVMHVLRVDPQQLLLLWRPIGTDDVNVYVSEDGATWRRAAREQQLALNHIVASSGISSGKVLYRLVKDGSVLERSVDGGRMWKRAMLLFPGQGSADVAVQEQIRVSIVGSDGLTVYARAQAANSEKLRFTGVYVSQDGGDRWQLFASDLVIGTTIAQYQGTIFAMNATGLIQSRDNGHTWSPAQIAQKLPNSLPLANAQNAPPERRRQKKLEVYQIEFSQADPQSAFLVTNGGLFITHDNGMNWCLTTFGSDVLYTVSSIAVADRSGSHILATTVDRSGPLLWESKDGGQSFQRIELDGKAKGPHKTQSAPSSASMRGRPTLFLHSQ